MNSNHTYATQGTRSLASSGSLPVQLLLIASGAIIGTVPFVVGPKNSVSALDPVPEEVVTKSIRVVDEQGRPAILISGHDLGTGNLGERGIRMFDESGALRLQLGLDSNGFSFLYEPNEGAAQFGFVTTTGGGCTAFISRPDKRTQVSIGLSDEGKISMSGWDGDTKVWKPLE